MSDWPRIFHRIWLDEPERPEFAEWRTQLQELHPDWEIRTWGSSDEARKIIPQDLLADWDRYLESDPFGRIPDILRYAILERFGGIYIDTDFEPLRSFEPLVYDDPRPFAAWENDRTMCTALLASPPNHPAIRELLAGLRDHLAAHESATPNVASGPEYATARWRVRSDVRRLPPWTFYPVGWWERELLGDPSNYHPDTYAVHHWAKGWGDEALELRVQGSMKVVILVPYRSDGAERDQAWRFCKAQLDQLGWPIMMGGSAGTWNRSEAINNAAKAAGDWDVAVIVDADTFHVKPDDIKAAVRKAHEYQSVIVPWRLRWKLNESGTQRLLKQGAKGFTHRHLDLDHKDRTPTRLPIVNRGGTVVVARGAWQAIGGFDEAFEGWGHEDVAFRIAARTLAPGGLHETQGVIYHLWHPRGEPNPNNAERKELYKQADGDAQELRMLIGGTL